MIEIEIRFSDTVSMHDSVGWVNHTAIVEWVAHARVKFIDKLIKDSGVEGIDHVLAHLSLDLREPVNWPGLITVDSSVEKMGTKSMETNYKLYKDLIVFAEAQSVSVFFDIKTGDTIRIPDELRKAL